MYANLTLNAPTRTPLKMDLPACPAMQLFFEKRTRTTSRRHGDPEAPRAHYTLYPMSHIGTKPIPSQGYTDVFLETPRRRQLREQTG